MEHNPPPSSHTPLRFDIQSHPATTEQHSAEFNQQNQSGTQFEETIWMVATQNHPSAGAQFAQTLLQHVITSSTEATPSGGRNTPHTATPSLILPVQEASEDVIEGMSIDVDMLPNCPGDIDVSGMDVDDVFTIFVEPHRVLEYDFFPPATRLPMYRAEDVDPYMSLLDWSYCFRLRRLWASFGIQVILVETVRRQTIEYLPLEIVYRWLFATFRTWMQDQPWISNLLDNSEYPTSVIASLRQVCQQVVDVKSLSIALEELCFHALQLKFIEVNNFRRDRDYCTSCRLEARRWSLRIVLGWVLGVAGIWEQELQAMFRRLSEERQALQRA